MNKKDNIFNTHKHLYRIYIAKFDTDEEKRYKFI